MPKKWKKCVPRYSTETFKTEYDMTLTAFKAESNKIVLPLSSQHQTITTCTSKDEKKRPETILMYNRTKVGVDALYQIAQAGTQHWTLAVLFNVLDFEEINS